MTIRKAKWHSRENKSKKKTNKSGSPKESSNKADKKDNKNVGKENNCMNKGNSEKQTSEPAADSAQANKAAPNAKMKKTEAAKGEDQKTQEATQGGGDDCKEIESLKKFLKESCKSKRKVLIKPNIPAKWINDLKAKLAKIQSK